MSRLPVVFISSVIKTLEDVRPTIYRIVRNEFGWKAWWSEEYPELRSASPTHIRQVCFSGIDSSDLYLGVFPNRYGSDPLGLAFTELEYHHAVSIGLPTLVYRLQDTTVVDPSQLFKQEAFLFLLDDIDIGNPRLVEVKNKNELYDKIRRDLDFFRKERDSGAAQWEDPAVSLRRLLLPVSSYQDLVYSPIILTAQKQFDADLVRIHFQLMDRAYAHSFHGAIEIASTLLDYMLSFPRWDDREYLDLLISLLGRWHKAGSWAGISGTLSPLAAAKAQMKARQLAEDYENLYETARAIASCCYSEKKLEEALKWSKISARFDEDHSISGGILLALGRINDAEQSYRCALEKHWCFGDEASYGLNLSHLGLIECKRGSIREGLKKLHEGVTLTGTSRGFRARTLRALASGLFIAGEQGAARSKVDEAIDYAQEYGLMGQLRSAEEMAKDIKSVTLNNL